ncbi:MAG: hypothetical protein DHS20C01_15990 [marine bacterium B5-7]|nr:MAG: hypothetical protein DHS20C01_15990 [marine bacterium B5-7]
MTYQALARKWRPGKFADVVGQPHVVSALVHALDNDRVHHAFLFTGTRGVGKTTLARLLAKSLNCEKGISSTPCGECSACISVDQGRFVDLLEIDAASRTRVDDTREILDNVQYAPTMGRYKVYLIDEVHMLSTHSFNALLKTLEEPPPHVKFLLATTDPQKLPATILSRCLQFNLRALDVAEITGQLRKIVDFEGVKAEESALELVARAADGSMRDGLSLLDQAIAFSGGQLDADSVRRMLGMIDGDRIVDILKHLVDGDTTALFEVIDAQKSRSINFTRALDDLLILLHEIALYQEAPALATERDHPFNDRLDLADRMDPQMVQLFYQIALIGKRDLSLAPDPARGFEMVLLRMLAFEPSTDLPGGKSTTAHPQKADGQATQNRSVKMANTPIESPAIDTDVKRPQGRTENRPVPILKPPRKTSSSSNRASVSRIDSASGPDSDPSVSAKSEIFADSTNASKSQVIGDDVQSWAAFVEGSNLAGLTRELAMNLELESIDSDTQSLHLKLREPLAHLNNGGRLKILTREVKSHYGDQYSVIIETHHAAANGTSPAAQREQRQREAQADALNSLKNDPDVDDLIKRFDAEIIEDSVRPNSTTTDRGN